MIRSEFRSKVAVAAALTALAGAASGQTINFGLDGLQEVPSVATPATGTGSLTYDSATGTINMLITVNGITRAQLMNAGPNPSPVHIHSAPAGSNGGIVLDIGLAGVGVFADIPGGFTLTVTDQPFSGATGAVAGQTLQQNLNDLLAGNLYVNVHTTAFPGGEVRGQIVPAPASAAVIGLGGLVAARRRRG